MSSPAIAEAPQERLGFVVSITRPDGAVLDISHAVSKSIGTISEAIETDLLELVHGDLDIEIIDPDGEVADFISTAAPGAEWSIAILRETGLRRPKWERIFGGVLDLPWSIHIDRKTGNVQLTAFAFSKLLEHTSAESVARTVTGKTGTGTIGTDTLTIAPDVSGFEVGDGIEIDDGVAVDARTVTAIDTGTDVLTLDADLSGSFSADPVTLTTPFYRGKGVEFLADALFSAAGIDDTEIALGAFEASFPFPSPLNTSGLAAGDPDVIFERGGKLIVQVGGTEYEAATAADGFTTGSSYTDPSIDWSPQFRSEPANEILFDFSGSVAAPRAWAPDFENDTWFRYVHTDEPTNQHVLYKYRKLVLANSGEPEIDRYTDAGANHHLGVVLDWVDIDGEFPCLAYAVARTSGAPDPHLSMGIVVFDDALGDAGTETLLYSEDAAVSTAGWVRALPGINRVLWINGTTMKVIQARPATILQTVTIPSGVIGETIRLLDNHVMAIYETTDEARLILWELDTWTVTADVLLTGTRLASATDYKATVWTLASGERVGIVYYGAYSIVAKGFFGTVPYADFAGMSVAKALRDLALLSMSFLSVDVHRIGRLRDRAFLETDLATVRDLPEPIDHTHLPLWEHYRTSAEVAGTTETGTAISRIVPKGSGDSAHRLKLDSPLITTDGIALALGLQYVSFFSQYRAQEEVTVIERTPLVHALDFVRLDDRIYLVLDADTDTVERRHSLILAEANL